MYETVSQTTYTNLSYYSVQQPLPTQIPNPTPLIQPQPLPDPYSNYGSYPPPNYAPFVPQPAYFSDPNAISYAIQPSASHGTYMDNLIGQTPRVPRKMMKKPKATSKQKSVNQNVWCDVCKIECNSSQEYEKHLAGKKHYKKLKFMCAKTTPVTGQSSLSPNNATEAGGVGVQCTPGVSSVPADLETKKIKLLEGGPAPSSLRLCPICNFSCNGEKIFSAHIASKEHIAQERALLARTNPSTISASNLETNSQKTTVVGAAWCEVCKISCTSIEGLGTHRQGKKHKKNLENLRKSISDTTPVGPVNIPTSAEDNPVVVQGTMPELETGKKKGARSRSSEELEIKKRKVLECGAAANAIKTCAICNVVCNSETVFNTHLAGQRHASLVKQVEAGGARS